VARDRLVREIVHVDARTPYAVEFWAFSGDGPPVERAFRVFGTGHALPPAAEIHRGSVVVAGGRGVWHLMEHG
jgi:hypothetical protein